jgi:hypothetical protein
VPDERQGSHHQRSGEGPPLACVVKTHKNVYTCVCVMESIFFFHIHIKQAGTTKNNDKQAANKKRKVEKGKKGSSENMYMECV